MAMAYWRSGVVAFGGFVVGFPRLIRHNCDGMRVGVGFNNGTTFFCVERHEYIQLYSLQEKPSFGFLPVWTRSFPVAAAADRE